MGLDAGREKKAHMRIMSRDYTREIVEREKRGVRNGRIVGFGRGCTLQKKSCDGDECRNNQGRSHNAN
jgi:hypothetical protein